MMLLRASGKYPQSYPHFLRLCTATAIGVYEKTDDPVSCLCDTAWLTSALPCSTADLTPGRS